MKIYSKKSIKEWSIYFLFFLVMAISLYNSITFKFTVDDAYISMRYARHLIEGNGLVYNIGEYVEGYSNFLWVIILALFGSAGFNLPASANVIGIICSLLTLVLVFTLMRKIYPDGGYVNIIPVAFLSTSWDFTGWATGGLETSFFTFLLFVLVDRFYGEIVKQNYKYPFSALLCGLLCLTRPEGFLFSGLYFIVLVFFGFFKRQIWLKESLWWLVLFSGIVIPWIIWKAVYYGDILPTSFYVKVNKLEYFDRGIRFATFFFKKSYVYLWLIPILFSLTPRNYFAIIVFLQCVIFFTYTIWVGGDWMAFRFYVPIIPPLMLLMGMGFNRIFDYCKHIHFSYMRNCLRFLVLAYILMALGLNMFTIYKYGKHRKFVFNEKLQLLNYGALHLPEENAKEIAQAFGKILLPNEVVAASFAGFTAMYTDIKVIDMLGLNDKYIAMLPIVSRGQPGHEKQAPFEYLKKQKALCLYPWPLKTPGNEKNEYSVEYESGKYLTFGSTFPYTEVVKKFQDRGLNVFYRGNFIPNPRDLTMIENNRNFNFETGTYLHWKVQGEAFGNTPQFKGKWDNKIRIKGYEGKFCVNSYFNSSDQVQGKLISDKFNIDGNTISFLIAGGSKRSTAINLLIGDKIVRSETGHNSEEMVRKYWDVTDYMGMEATIEIVDFDSGDWGHIVVDDIRVGNF